MRRWSDMFVSRKKYVRALEQWNHWQEVAEEKTKENDRLLAELKDMHALSTRVNDLSGEIHNYNKLLMKELDRVKLKLSLVTKQRDELQDECNSLETNLLARCGELEAKLSRTTEHIQLADGTIFAIEEALYRQKGDSVIQLHIDEYYEEVKLLDTK
jgi:predicted nuclease with TOPRIM domain